MTRVSAACTGVPSAFPTAVAIACPVDTAIGSGGAGIPACFHIDALEISTHMLLSSPGR